MDDQRASNQLPNPPTHTPGQVISPDPPNGGEQPAPAQSIPSSPQPPAPQPTPLPVDTTQAAPFSPQPPVEQPAQNASPVPKSKKSRLPLLVALVILCLLLLVGGSIYALHKHKTVTTTKIATGSGSEKLGSGSAKATVKAPVTTTVNCSSAGCFNQHFSACTPATLTATSSLGDTKYQIYGKKGTGCSMLFEYTANPNAAWVNQPMTCTFDNSQTLDNAVTVVFNNLFTQKNTYGCTGPLVVILQSQ
jgi:hypothetical protein